MNSHRTRLGRTIAGIGVFAVIGTMGAPPAGAGPIGATHPPSGTESAAGHTITWSLGGVFPVPADRADLLAYPYDGVIYQGTTVTFSGSAEFALGPGLVTNLDMTASMGWMMDAKQTATLRKAVGPGNYSLPFNMTLKIPAARSAEGAKAAPAAPLNAIQAMVSSRNCNDNGVCDGPEAIMYYALLPGKAPKAPKVDRIAPTVKAIPHKGIIGKTKEIPAGYKAYDSDGPVMVHADLYSQGEIVSSVATPKFVPSGHEGVLRFPASAGGTGPFYYCLWAEDKAGNRSPGQPKSDCAWLSREVPIESVSNGCGTDAWGAGLEAMQNALGDTRLYGSTTVTVKPACDLHDAAYVGATVFDKFKGHPVDFRTMTRKEADHKFLADIRRICEAELKGTKDRKELVGCKNGIDLAHLQPLITSGGLLVTGLKVIGAMTYFEGVQTYGGVGYDWDATTAGPQHSMPSSTDPRGGGRNGA